MPQLIWLMRLCCRLRDKAEAQKKADLKDADKARAKAIRVDNEESDIDDMDREPWTRKTLHNRLQVQALSFHVAAMYQSLAYQLPS